MIRNMTIMDVPFNPFTKKIALSILTILQMLSFFPIIAGTLFLIWSFISALENPYHFYFSGISFLWACRITLQDLDEHGQRLETMSKTRAMLRARDA